MGCVQDYSMKSLPVDWPGIAVAVASGVTLLEVSIQTGVKLSTVKSRSAREGWKRKAKAVQETNVAIAVEAKQMVPKAPNGVDVVAETLAQRQKHTRLGLSLFTVRAARVASRLPKKELLENAPAVKAVADVAGKVWPDQLVGEGCALQFFAITVSQEREEKPAINV